MSAVSATTSTARYRQLALEGREATRGASDLLPAPTTSASGDAATVLYALMNQRRVSSMQTGQSDVATRHAEQERHIAEERAALEREREAEGDGSRGLFASIEHIATTVVDDAEDLRVMDVFTDTKQNLVDTWNSPNFWKDVEKGAKVVAEIAAVVAASATTVVTFGAGAPVLALVCVGVAMSAASMADSEFHVLEKCGVDAKTAGWVDFGLAVGGAACNLAGGAAAGANAGTSGGFTLAKQVAITATVTQAGATMMEGGAHVKTGSFEADAMDAQADATEARHASERSQRVEAFLIEALAESQKSQGRALASLRGSIATGSQTMTVASGRA